MNAHPIPPTRAVALVLKLEDLAVMNQLSAAFTANQTHGPDGDVRRSGTLRKSRSTSLRLALLGLALVVDDPEWVRYGIGGSLFPLLVGLALLARHFWLSRVLEREIAAGA